MNKNKLFIAVFLLSMAVEANAEEAGYKTSVDDALSALNRLESKSVKPVPPSQSHVILLGDSDVKGERQVLKEAQKKNLNKGNILKNDNSVVDLKPESGTDWPSK